MSDLSIRNVRRHATSKKEDEKRIRRHRPDYILLIFMVFLMMLGLIVLVSINSALTQSHGDNMVVKQAIFLIAGSLAFTIAAHTPLRIFEKNATKLMWIAVAASALLFVLSLLPGQPMVSCELGACRWFLVNGISFQAAELIKFALLFYVAVFIAARVRAGELNNVKTTLVPIALAVAVMAFFIIVLQKDMGTGIIMLSIVFAMLFMSGISKKLLFSILGVTVLLGILLIVLFPHRIERVATFLGTHSDTAAASSDETWHIDQALIAVGSGGMFGKGLGKGVQSYGYLPVASSDSIFAVIAEMFGFFGTIAVLLIFGGILYRLLLIMDRSERLEFRLIMAGIIAWVGMHILVNIGAMLGVVPLTGITLPFLSTGGTSLIMMMLLCGVAFQISRYTSHAAVQTNKGVPTDAYYRRGRGIGGSRNPSPRRNQRA